MWIELTEMNGTKVFLSSHKITKLVSVVSREGHTFTRVYMSEVDTTPVKETPEQILVFCKEGFLRPYYHYDHNALQEISNLMNKNQYVFVWENYK